MQSRLGSGIYQSTLVQDNKVSVSMMHTAGDVVTIAKQIDKLHDTSLSAHVNEEAEST